MKNSFVKPPDEYVKCPHCKVLVTKTEKANCPNCGEKLPVSWKDTIKKY